MNASEAAQVLTVAAVYDNRKPSAAAAQAWAADLEKVTMAEGAAAVREHYLASPGVWIMPGHVVAVVARRRRAESRGLWLAELRALRNVDPDDPHAVLDALRRVHATASREPERRALPPGKFADSPAQAERNARGADVARQVLPGRHRIPAPRRDAMAELRQITAGPGWPEPDDEGGQR